MRKFLFHPGFRRIIFFFPFQLLFLHIKKNLLLLLVWALLFGFVTQTVAARYGVPYLFLDPEYMDEVSWLSYFILGFSCGGFMMAFNIASYILNSFRFPFLATLSHPFAKYCLNNFIIPVLFLLVYVYHTFIFLQNEAVYSYSQTVLMISSFLAGVFIFYVITLLYFFRTNKDIHRMFGITSSGKEDDVKLIRRYSKRKDSWKNPYLIKESRDWYVETYLTYPFNIRLVRAVRHYKREMLKRVFNQNHRNAAVYSILAIFSLLLLGFFREVPLLMIPAGASIFLLLTMLIMLPVPLYSLFRGWAPVVLIVLLMGLNYLYRFDFFNNMNMVFGLNYLSQKAIFSNERLQTFSSSPETAETDSKKTLEILNRWRMKNLRAALQKNKKPKFVIICTSGGGLRSALWTFYALQYADSLLNGELLKHTALITGSSGGMIGAAYLRELFWQNQSGKLSDFYSPSYRAGISKDILNAVGFSIATSDWFLSFQDVQYGKYKYRKDRGYVFERRLDENLGYIFGNKRLLDYHLVESEAIVPLMIFSPTIVNDGRKLIVSSQPVSYLTQNVKSEKVKVDPLMDGIEYSRFFKEQGGDSILFTSVLRMSSTFPYITPILSLPSEPAIEIMDAGMRDNYGMEVALKFLYVFRNWISTNTSGVIILQIRDRHKEVPIDATPPSTILNSLTRPLESFYGNLFYMQDFSQAQLTEYASAWFDGSVDILDFELKNEKKDRISLSWHLTNREKQKVLRSIHLAENQESIKKLIHLLK